MEEELHKRRTQHSEEVVSQILSLHDQGMRSADIYKQSKELFGYRIKQSTISNILKRNGKIAKNNTFRRKRRKRKD